jgi:hypothetical protein
MESFQASAIDVSSCVFLYDHQPGMEFGENSFAIVTGKPKRKEATLETKM